MGTRQVQTPHIQKDTSAASASSRTKFHLVKVLGRWLAYVLTGLCSLVLLLFIALYVCIKLYPQEISQEISENLAVHTNAELTFSSIDFALLPLPALSLADVHVQHEDVTLKVAYATLEPSLWTLFQGKFSLGAISLWRPVFYLKEQALSSVPPVATSINPSENITEKAPAQDSSQENVVQGALEEHMPPTTAHVGELVQYFFENLATVIPSFAYGSSLEILHGGVTLEQDLWSVVCKDINTKLELGALGALEGDIHFEDTFIEMAQKPYAHMLSFIVTLWGDVDDAVHLRVQGQGAVADMLANTRVDMTVSYTISEGLTGMMSKVLPSFSSDLLPFSSDENSAEHTADTQGISRPVSQPTAQENTHGILNAQAVSDAEHSPLQMTWDIQTHLLWHDEPIAVQSVGKIHGDLRKALYLQDVHAQLEHDAAQLNGVLQLEDLEDPVLTGHIYVPRLSLTQWFGFARHMPPGLQHALHKVRGELEFTITKEGLTVPRLKATAAEAAFTGQGGVASWSNAVVFLELLTPEIFLGKVYPEAEGVKIEAPTFVHKPLTPMPGTPEAAADTGVSVSYDINVAAQKMYAWDLPMEGMHFRACPIELDREKFSKKHKDAAVLSGNVEKFFGGRAEGKALLYRSEDDESAYDITALLRNVRAEKPVARILGQQLIGGRMSADATVTAKGVYAGEFLVSLGGSASLRVDNGNFYSRSKRKVPFKVMTLAGTVSGRNPEKVKGSVWPSKLLYSGNWRATLDTKDISAKSTWNGALEFTGADYGTVALRNIPGKVSVSFAPSLTTLPHATDVDFTGELSLDTTKGVVSLRKGKGTATNLANMQVSGSGSLNFSRDITWTASVQSKTNAISSVLARLDADGESLLPRTAPQQASLNMQLAYAKNLLRMEKIQMKLDTTLITGSMRRTFTSKPAWSFDLAANEFDYDKIIRGKTTAAQKAAKPTAAEKAAASKPLSWKWLQGLEAKGDIRIGTFLMHKVRAKNVAAPVRISANTLNCTPTKATFYNGDTAINFKGTVKGGVLQTQLGAVVKKANLFALSEDLGLETVIAGNTDFWLSAQGGISSSADIPRAFDGTWRLQVRDGFMQSKDKKGKLTGKPTYISNLSDAGTITKGVLHSLNFLLQGTGIAATGKGKVDLVKDTLDMRLVVSTGGFSDIPVRFHGSFDDPQRDVDTGAVFLSALGSLGTGVFDIIGAIFGAFFGIFK